MLSAYFKDGVRQLLVAVEQRVSSNTNGFPCTRITLYARGCVPKRLKTIRACCENERAARKGAQLGFRRKKEACSPRGLNLIWPALKRNLLSKALAHEQCFQKSELLDSVELHQLRHGERVGLRSTGANTPWQARDKFQRRAKLQQFVSRNYKNHIAYLHWTGCSPSRRYACKHCNNRRQSQRLLPRQGTEHTTSQAGALKAIQGQNIA